MSVYKLSDDSYKVLQGIDLSEAKSVIMNDDKNEIEVDDVDSLLEVIDIEIVTHGLTEDQELATEYGWKLYALYDELFYQ